MRIVVTGGAGFIGSALCRYILLETQHSVINIDKLTYASNLQSLASVATSERYSFYKVDICDRPALDEVFEAEQPDMIFHLAAESHVDRSIEDAGAFIQTNLVGTYTVLEAARAYQDTLRGDRADVFRMIHVSTDEVFGSLGKDGAFTETSPYDPSSPYSASKAGADHLASAWQRTHGLPVIITNCSNNFGPFQFPEKLIPLMILNAREGRPLPVYGAGDNVRDWLYVDDHARALLRAGEAGTVGETYNIGANGERTNLQVVETICDLIDARLGDHANRRELIEFVSDRPGHDFRYAIDATKIRTELGWTPNETFESGLQKTVDWYLDHHHGSDIWVRNNDQTAPRAKV